MPYIGHSPEVAQRRYESIDDISGSFNGSTTSFALQVGGVTPAPFPVASENVLISLGGVIQEPDGTGTNGFQLTGTNIVFSSAPAAGQSFFGVILAGADYVTAGHAFPDGDAAGPSITFSQDLDTGVFRAGSGAIGFGGNGSEHARFDGSGRLLVGTTTARGAGDVTAPLQVEGTGFNTSSLNLISNAGASSGNVSHISLAKSRGTSDGSSTVVASGDSLGTIQWCGADGTDLNSVGASINGAVDNTPGSNDMPGRLTFATTADGASSPTERLRIDSSGNVGIGLTSPSSKTHIKGGSLTIEHGSPSTGTGQLNINSEVDSQATLSYDDQGSIVFGTAATPHNQGSFSEKMRLDSGGSVGIGITNPGEYHANANDLVLANGMTIANTGTAHMYFADSSTGTGEYVGQLNYLHSLDRFQFVVGNTARALLLSTGDWATFSTAVNIDIANTQSAGINEAFIYARHSSTQLTGGTNSFRVYTNGNVQNTNNSYGSISDQNLKENIVDATSQWDDIKALQVRKYNFREDTGQQTHTQLGLIAQEVESVSPGLVETTYVKEGETVLDADGNQMESIKAINYSVLYMKAVKALQEAQTRIESLETQNTAQQTTIDDLLARVTALEAA